ncbi:MAG: metal-dependent hydrolase [Saprospiraceae bacterium]
MKLPNHLAGGTLITAILSSLSGLNVFQSLTTIITMLVATTLPDIDHPKSVIGRTCKPISLFINRRWGHRTITHSLITLLILTLFLAILEKGIIDKNTLSLIFFYAYLSHLLLDMVTLMGVPLLYPFSKNPFVLPGNPRYRIRTGDIRAETIAFCLFILLSISLRPLFQQGFWTSYNRLFGTMHHLAAEFKKADDLLEVTYYGKRGTETIQGKGLCIEADINKAILIENDKFVVLDKGKMIIDKVIPTHTGRQFTFSQIPLIAVTVDSLNTLLHNQWIKEIDLSAESPFRTIANGIPSEQKRFKSQLLTSIWFQEIDIPPSYLPSPDRPQRGHTSITQGASPDSATASTSLPDRPQRGQIIITQGASPELQGALAIAPPSFIYQPNPRIPILQQKLRLLQTERLSQQEAWRQHQQHIDNLKQLLQTTTAITEKERLYIQLVAAQKIAPPRIDRSTETLLLTEIQQLQRAEKLKNEEQRLKHLQDLQSGEKTATLLSGFVTTLEIH